MTGAGKGYTYTKGEKDKDFVIASMRKYVDKEQELDKFLRSLVRPYMERESLRVLDACCGIGHVSHLLSKASPGSTFLGVDQTPYLIDQARELYGDQERLTFEVGDVYELAAKYPKAFDLTISWKTISWLPYYEEMMRALLAVTRKHLFLSSLFYDGDIDFQIKVTEFKKEAGQEGHNMYYNVYSLPRFRRFLSSLGVREVEAHDFEMTVDIPRPPVDLMGTYTERLEDGRKIQISGAIVMSWKVIRIDL